MMIPRPHPVWWEAIRVAALRVRIYRSYMVLGIVSILIQLFLQRTIWSAVYGSRETVNGISSETLLVYITISSLHLLAFDNGIAFEVGERIETGQIAMDMIRPFGFLKQMIALQVGSTIGFAPIIAIAIPAAMLIGSLRVPTATNLLAYLAAFVLAYAVMTLTWLLVGLGGFWLISISGLRATLSVISGLLSGAVVPLWFMPGWMRGIVEVLPFQAMAFLPASIFSGQVRGIDVIRPLVIQVVWIVLLVVAVQFVWQRAQRKLVIQGG